jgi:hypothetical protein
MSILVTLLLGAAGVAVVLALYKAAVAARQLAAGDGRLRLMELARARGLALPPTRKHGELQANAIAVRRCLLCRRQARCDELAAAQDWAALGEICPNRAYLDSLRAG